jgi:2-C-methyl-D-erythritol 4-phosphate cytidylyltransferase / 2-C-methyl-D-erythritol 2,4-cyclodiphosphate synthase
LTTAALIVAAGRGTRVGGPLPKQYALLGGVPVLARTLQAFVGHPAVDLVQVVIAAEDAGLYEAAVAGVADKLLPVAYGGATRQASVRAGLQALAAHRPERVLIHDAVRPFVAVGTITRVLEALADSQAAVAAVALTDTLKRSGPDGRIAATLDRTDVWRAQTPQGFRFPDILAAHEAAASAGVDLTDDAGVAEWGGFGVALVPDSAANIKLTTPEDLAMAETRFRTLPDVRTGSGFDVHRLTAGDHVWLCGVRIAHTHMLQGHSDADVGLHALTDALLGAIGDGDIGQHFPDHDPRWKGAASHIFLSEAARRVRAQGGVICNVDVTLLCEAPKIAPHRAAMRSRIGAILGIDPARVGVKATTTEGLGFTGRKEGIAALAAATVVLNSLSDSLPGANPGDPSA